ncbi:DUF3046 domain-containing protein [Ornithinimicrobium sp. F0845]|uniref:DUF3046 domain-containing protein n=1 Tax=Ornithinimicrobium sp. F0845 TaxID=2926412 RepID=UPI001FF1913F|nr:DUF3046 domain-containing protein [Ornithinimicrobium sp. F0845]MCK0111470.1 DUF3046 domain-containing protein [Ornithinimicrobium sp. F0845]
MRVSEFWRAVEDEFGGPYGRHQAASQVLSALGERTPVEAIEAGMPVKQVWVEFCRHMGVPEERWLPQEVRPRRTR